LFLGDESWRVNIPTNWETGGRAAENHQVPEETYQEINTHLKKNMHSWTKEWKQECRMCDTG